MLSWAKQIETQLHVLEMVKELAKLRKLDIQVNYKPLH